MRKRKNERGRKGGTSRKKKGTKKTTKKREAD